MSGWMRYPGRIAHVVDDAKPITRPGQPYPERIGTRWRTRCSRELLVRFADVRGIDLAGPSAWWVDPIELAVETPRGWCLRCAYWTALEALILPARSFDDFVERVYAGRYRLV